MVRLDGCPSSGFRRWLYAEVTNLDGDAIRIMGLASDAFGLVDTIYAFGLAGMSRQWPRMFGATFVICGGSWCSKGHMGSKVCDVVSVVVVGYVVVASSNLCVRLVQLSVVPCCFMRVCCLCGFWSCFPYKFARFV